jgi:hypothetical protein
MISRSHKALKATALLLLLCVTPVYVHASLVTSPQVSGTIKTTNNQPILVNGNSAPSGTTILPGTTISTPEGVGATLSLGFADLEIAPGSEVVVEFSSDGKVTVRLVKGCALLKVKGNGQGSIDAPDGSSTKAANTADVCFPQGATNAIVNQGAASNAIGGGGGTTAGAGGAGGGGGLSKGAWIAILGGAGAGIITAIALAGGGTSSPA